MVAMAISACCWVCGLCEFLMHCTSISTLKHSVKIHAESTSISTAVSMSWNKHNRPCPKLQSRSLLMTHIAERICVPKAYPAFLACSFRSTGSWCWWCMTEPAVCSTLFLQLLLFGACRKLKMRLSQHYVSTSKMTTVQCCSHTQLQLTVCSVKCNSDLSKRANSICATWCESASFFLDCKTSRTRMIRSYLTGSEVFNVLQDRYTSKYKFGCTLVVFGWRSWFTAVYILFSEQ